VEAVVEEEEVEEDMVEDLVEEEDLVGQEEALEDQVSYSQQNYIEEIHPSPSKITGGGWGRGGWGGPGWGGGWGPGWGWGGPGWGHGWGPGWWGPGYWGGAGYYGPGYYGYPPDQPTTVIIQQGVAPGSSTQPAYVYDQHGNMNAVVVQPEPARVISSGKYGVIIFLFLRGLTFFILF
jgi:hypothetical protein